MKNTLNNIDKISKDLKKLSEFDIEYKYSPGLGFICSSPFFLDFYWIIYVFDNVYQIKTFRNNILEYSYPFTDYFYYNIIKDQFNILKKEILYDFGYQESYY